MLTGHCDLDKAPLAQDHTVVLLMGVSRLEELTAQLIAQGNSANTPCAIIEDGYGPRQRTTTGTLASIAQTARQVGVQSPRSPLLVTSLRSLTHRSVLLCLAVSVNNHLRDTRVMPKRG